jgi:dihydroflavonol-4-reductase
MATGSVLVTGGTGFLGRALAERLLRHGDQVKALARSDASASALAAMGAEPVRGDVLDGDSLVAAMRGCELVYHAAGANAFCLHNPSPMFEVNVRGSKNVVHAAARAGTRRLVYTSSAATLGEASGTIGSEESPHRGWFLSDYERSKFEGEQTVLAAARETGLDVVSVNPASVQGPGRATGSAKLLLDYVNGRIKAVVDSRLSLVDIADCTEGHLLAGARGAPG